MRKKKKAAENTKLVTSCLVARENYSLSVNVCRSKTSLVLKFFIGYLINKEIIEACIRIAMLISISKKKLCFSHKRVKPNCNFSKLEKNPCNLISLRATPYTYRPCVIFVLYF